MEDRIEILKQSIDTFFERKRREPTNAMSNNISQLGYGVRRMVLNRVAGKYKRPISMETQKRFYAGNIMHDVFKHQILPTIPNVEVQSTELPVEDRRSEIRGYIDASIRIKEAGPYPSEIKSMMYLKRIADPKEFLNSPEQYLQCYYHALNFYLFCSNRPEGQFILADFSFNHILLPMVMDYGEAAKIEAKCTKEVNPLVHQWDNKDFQPEDIQYLPSCEECDKYCPFESLCGRVTNPSQDIGDLDVERIDFLAARRLELEEGAKEYEQIKDALRDLTRGYETVVTPNFMIQGKEMAGRTIYNVPDEIKIQYKAIGKPYWQIKKITPLEEVKTDAA